MIRTPAIALAVTLAAGALLAPRVAIADDGQTPAAHFDRGVELFRDGDYRSALIEFRRSYELSKNWRILYNVAETQYQILDYASARETFRRYLTEGGALVPAARRAEIDAELAKLDARVAYLTVDCDAEGAEISVDDHAAGTAPLAAEIAVNPGAHRIRATKAGLAGEGASIELAASEHGKVALHLAAIAPRAQARASVPASAPSAVTPQAPATPPMPPSPARKVSWIGLTFTGLFAAGASVYGALALDASAHLKDDRARTFVTSGELSADARRVRILSVTSDAFLAATVISGGITAYLFLRGPAAPREQGVDSVRVSIGMERIDVVARW